MPPTVGRLLLPVLLAAVVLAGCAPVPRGGRRGGPASAPSTTPSSDKWTDGAGRPVDLVPVTVAGLEKAVAARKGQVVLIDVWFIECGPCVKNFPHLVDLHRRYGPDGLACVSLDVIPEEWDMRDKVVAFLKKQGATFPNYILKDDEKTVAAWQTEYGVEYTPAVILFDRAGGRVKLPPRPTHEALEAKVRELLAG